MTDLKSCCIPDKGNGGTPPLPKPACASKQVHHQCAYLDGGWFSMGAVDGPHPEDGEGPIRDVWVDRFAIAVATITNREFAVFADAIGYRSVAERQGSSFVFQASVDDQKHWPSMRQAPWWREVSSACWRKPFGANSGIEDILDHPVVHVSLFDAQAYCAWAGVRLPTEAEWEFAARGGLKEKAFPWGDELEPDGQHRSNVWQGNFPHENTGRDGYEGTAPALCYEPNKFGLYGMTGNVWEWTANRFTHLHSPRPERNPTGPLNGEKYVAKGGSYLCHASYCCRYRTSSRQALSPQTTSGSIGFRVAALSDQKSKEQVWQT